MRSITQCVINSSRIDFCVQLIRKTGFKGNSIILNKLTL